jgi:hypothetical protein
MRRSFPSGRALRTITKTYTGSRMYAAVGLPAVLCLGGNHPHTPFQKTPPVWEVECSERFALSFKHLHVFLTGSAKTLKEINLGRWGTGDERFLARVRSIVKCH